MKKSSGKWFILALALAIAAVVGVACDTGVGGTVCSKGVGVVGGTLSSRLYYPCNLQAPTGATTLTGGFMETKEMVAWLANDLAKAGYVVLAFTPTNTMGMVSGWKNAHKNAIEKLQQINSNDAQLRGKIDKYQTCGHSKGGGGALWAASELKGQLTTVVGMAPWQEQFSSYGPNADTKKITAATLIQAGSADSLAIGTMTMSEYNGLGNIDKCYISYPGYGHMAWAMATGAQAQNLSGDIISWMNYFMKNQGSKPSQCR